MTSLTDLSPVFDEKEAEHLLRDLKMRRRQSYASATGIAVLHAGLGDTTEAFRWLAVAAEDRDPHRFCFFVVDPILQGLRKDARGVALLKRMNLPATR